MGTLSKLLILAALSLGQIEGPDSVPTHQIATVTTDVVADGYIWFVFPIEPNTEALQSNPKVFQFTGSPGVHQVSLVPLKDGIPQGKFWKTVTFGPTGPIPPPGPTPPPPPPGPTPPPGPLPPPTPITEPVHVTLIYDMDRIATSRPAVVSNLSIREAAKKLNIFWRTYDDSSSDLIPLKILPTIEKIGVPALVIQRTNGTVIDVLPCPATPNSVIDLFNVIRGNP